jgi:predicted dehydrogenase
MAMKPVKLGIIGCGIATQELHAPALLKLKDKFEVISVCNINEPKAKECADVLGGTPFVSDYRHLLNTDIEAVDVAVPYNLNYEITRAALEAGKHVIVEKPLAHDLEDARRMLELDRRFPQVKMVAENFRYHPAFRRLKALMAEGRIGEPLAIFWNVFRLVDANNKYYQTGWRVENRFPGGFVTDGGVHNIAALRLMFGDIARGQSFTRSINPEIGDIDSLSFQFETVGGVQGVLNIFVSVKGLFKNEMAIVGCEGAIEAVNNKSIRILRQGRSVEEETIPVDTSYLAEFEDFFQAIRSGKRVASPFSEAFRDLQVILSAVRPPSKMVEI